MTQLTKRKLISGGLRAYSVLVAGAVPIWLIAQKFPLWAKEVKAEEEKAEEAKEA